MDSNANSYGIPWKTNGIHVRFSVRVSQFNINTKLRMSFHMTETKTCICLSHNNEVKPESAFRHLGHLGQRKIPFIRHRSTANLEFPIRKKFPPIVLQLALGGIPPAVQYL